LYEKHGTWGIRGYLEEARYNLVAVDANEEARTGWGGASAAEVGMALGSGV
jgi:hypothetical protein